VVNVRVEMPRTSCHLSIFSLGKRGFQLGLATGRSRRTTLPPAPVTRGRALEHLLSKV